jgi:hypothetical protein
MQDLLMLGITAMFALSCWVVIGLSDALMGDKP